MVGARVTITDNNTFLQNQMIDYFYELGIRYIWTDPLFYSVGEVPVSKDKRKKDSYHFNMDTYVDNYIAAYKFANQKGLFWGSFLAVNFDGESEYHCRSCTPLSSPHLTPDGYISACDMVLLGSKPYHMSVFVIGKWDFNKKLFEIDMEKVHNLENRKSSNIEHCKNCVVKLHCGGYCLGEIVNESGYLNGQNTLKCQAIRKLYKELGPCKPYKYLHP